MKKLLLVFLVAALLLVLAGCPGWFGPSQPEIEKLTIPEIKAWIDDNNATTTSEKLVRTEGIVTYTYSNYAYIVDSGNNGIKVYSDGNPDLSDYEAGDEVEVTGCPLLYYGDEYEIDITVEKGNIKKIGTSTLPDPYTLPVDSELSIDVFGKLVQITGKYNGQNTYGHYDFQNGTKVVEAVSYSEMPSMTVGGTYTVMGVTGYSYGYKLFVWDENNVTEIEIPILPEKPQENTLAITEIQYKPSGDEEPYPYEFVEIYNATNTDIPLGAVILTDGEGSYQFPNDFELGTGEFVVVGETIDASQNIDLSWSGKIALSNGGEEVILHVDKENPKDPAEGKILCKVSFKDISSYGQSVYLKQNTADPEIIEDFDTNWDVTPAEEQYMYFETTYNGNPAKNYGTPGLANPGW